ncbi:conserved hypothetical protein, membrane [Candidatus Desulfofervidus auxilii]|uniref:Uncharacterized protein n=1 Tax=Desulfofervidus auxilii TaxID=1621989 RepID=A0A7U4QK58_DESA2|nr:hypothetical protein [Candidatus Desulfofervidus auxilii]AMM40842.1 conserved hypothetical protein, membrane [Candidatus Desulfofervidus auxilii]CAD7774863.1 hypothetical protein BLFGPEAP_01202 [Candidatus Methanoperedenaceae archaeon GB50]CAD7776368.1 hypothetical protein DMNBHIDG_01277 [Candidatus Methanoperedenaceae archaeon GB37]
MSDIDRNDREKFNDLKIKLEILEQIYDRQHYFIDRHEVMAEKMLTSLMITGGLVSVVFSLISRSSISLYVWYLLFTSGVLFFVSFLITFYLVIQTIRPLSSKAIKEFDEYLLPKIGKPWVKSSLIYHRGILKFIESCLGKNNNPVKEYYSAINMNNILNDYIKQIFILAYYSNYKRKQLEKASKYIIITIILGIFSILISVLSITYPT